MIQDGQLLNYKRKELCGDYHKVYKFIPFTLDKPHSYPAYY
jgi:hypothetical protein